MELLFYYDVDRGNFILYEYPIDFVTPVKYLLFTSRSMSWESLAIAVIGAGIPVSAAALGYWLSVDNTKKRNGKALLSEIHDLKTAINNKLDLREELINGDVIKYADTTFATTSFTNVISAGHFSYFNDDVRKALRDFYSDIDAHNKIHARMTALFEDLVVQDKMDKYVELIAPYMKTLTAIDEKINSQFTFLIATVEKESYVC